MNITNQHYQSIHEKFGTPCFVYDTDEVSRRIDRLNSAFDKLLNISYAMKCNPHGEFLSLFKNAIPSLDVSSGGELQRALKVGWEAEKISFTGPAKQRWELQAAVDAGIGKMVVESVDEALQLDSIAAQVGKQQKILIRIAPATMPPGFGVGMSGKPCQFGIDEEDMVPALEAIKKLQNLRLVGFHAFSGTQCLNSDAVVGNFQYLTQMFEHFCKIAGIEPEALIFGSGFGIPYHEGDEPLNITDIAEKSLPLFHDLKQSPGLANCQFYLELGRWLVGEAGSYLTSVVAKKESRGKSIALCDGGMNHHLGACGHLGSVIHRNYQMFRLKGAHYSQEQQSKGFTLVGPLCTSIDTLGKNVEFDGLEVGDVIVVKCSGAYGFSASPLNFISHKLPKEVFVSSLAGEMEMKLAAPEFTPSHSSYNQR